MLVAGGLALGLALVDSGLAELMVGQVSFGLPLLVLLLLLSFVSVIFSNIMSNTATTTILVPLAILLFKGDEMTMVLAVIVLAPSASCALFLPVPTPPNAIAFGTGYLKQKDFRQSGLYFGLLGLVLALLWVSLPYALLVD
jgi:sodium-dependent dicarboxylate transporter 2/3/5